MSENKTESSPLLAADRANSSYENARTAYNNVDIEFSKQIHDSRTADDLENEFHQESGGYLKTVVFGGLDGILTIFAIVAGAYGGGFSWEVVLIMGISNVFADALAMGAGEYLSSKAHRDYVLTEKRREQWEYKNYKDGEIKEMVILFNQRGMGLADAELVVKKMAEYEDFFIDLMVTEELGLTLPDEDEASLLKDAFVMFMSFLLFGSFPLVPFVLGPLGLMKMDSIVTVAFLFTGISLFSLGAIKSSFRYFFKRQVLVFTLFTARRRIGFRLDWSHFASGVPAREFLIQLEQRLTNSFRLFPRAHVSC